MRLERIGKDRHNDVSDKYTPDQNDGDPDDWNIRVDFEKFGTGTEDFDWLRVLIGWSDVEALILTFSEMGHPEAMRLGRARDVARAIEEVAKNAIQISD